MLNTSLSRIRSECPGRHSANQNASFLSISSSLIGENNGNGSCKSFSVQPRLVIGQQSAVEQDVKVFMRELKKSSVAMYFSVNSL